MERETKNFPKHELRCDCSFCRGDEPHQCDDDALDALQAVRAELEQLMPEDCGMTLTSAYRCARHPEEAKKVKPGQHFAGTAFDIAVGWGRKRMLIVELALKHGFRGFGFANGFLHIDYRASALTSWTYR